MCHPLATHASLDANIDGDDYDDNTDGDDHDDKLIIYDDRLTVRDSLMRSTIFLGQISILLEKKIPKSYTYTYEI